MAIEADPVVNLRQEECEALEQFEAYVTKSGTADKQVSGWIAELKLANG